MDSLKQRVLKKIINYKQSKEPEIKQIAQSTKTFYRLQSQLIKKNIISEDEFLLILSKECKMPYIDLDKYKLSPDNKELLSKELAFRYRVLPLSNIGSVLTVATANPLDVVALDDLMLATPFKKVDLVLAREGKIQAALERLYSDRDIVSVLKEEKPEDTGQDDDSQLREVNVAGEKNLETLVKESKLPPIVRVVNLIIYEGLNRRASDIHIEPTEIGLVVRYRIDGVLHHGLDLPKRNQNAILARLKIMSSVNITEFRVPQDGRFKVKFQEREIDFRVSTLPTNFGEKVVLRILDKENLSVGLDKLGFSPTPLKLFQQALKAPFGIILVTGPTGSGKSTTLYSIINQVNQPEYNIITIENPVEYQIDGISQIQTKPDIGLTFASSLRSVLRQSPDVIMVGEIRDFETADIAVKASLTGEFIFSTLHTNNAAGAITRLIDMGIEPFLVSSSLIASTAQRLVRKLCPECREPAQIKPGLLKKVGYNRQGELFMARGCSYCNNTGYRGRVALLEVLLFDDKMRQMVIAREDEKDIINYAVSNKSFVSLKEDGFDKCAKGVTTLEEVLRVAA
jgi:type IV pilus assembly protein PilB